MDWRDHIHSDPEILRGKPVIKGSRLAVEFILGLLAEGWTKQEILENYPTLTMASIEAALSFAAECIREEAMFAILPKAS